MEIALSETAIATDEQPEDDGLFHTDDQALVHQVGNVTVVWLSQKDHPKYLEWRNNGNS